MKVNKEELISQIRTPAPQIKIAQVLWVVGMMVIVASAIIWVVLAVMTGDYFTSSKAARDAAQAGSPILAQQQTIETVKDWVLPFAFVGLATFLLGFGFGFANILRNIKLRGQTLAVVLPALKQRKSSS